MNMRKKPLPPVRWRRERGFTMVEMLVAMVVLAIGLLGIAALYLDSLRAGRTAIFRTQAVNLAADMADRIRSNRAAGLDYDAAYTDTPVEVAACATTAGCTPQELALSDLALWKAAIAVALPGGGGQVQVTAPAAAGETTSYVVTVRWSEVGADQPLEFQLAFTS